MESPRGMAHNPSDSCLFKKPLPAPAPRLTKPIITLTDNNLIGTMGNNSRNSWEETYKEMCQGLQRICGSPVKTPTSPRLVRLSSTTKVKTPVKETKDFLSRPDFRRCESLHGSMSRSQLNRQLTVRHIETQAELGSKLSAICRSNPRRDYGGNQDDRSADITTQSTSPKLYLLQNEFRVQLKLNLISVCVNDLVLSVSADRQLIVRSIRALRRSLIETSVPDHVDINCLAARLMDDGSLIIRERTNTQIKIESIGCNTVFLPILHLNESKRELTVVLHVPEVFQSDDVTVKTVDSKLLISVNAGNMSPIQKSLSLLNPAASPTIRHSFQVTMRLPDGADSRTVTAILMKQNQLVIKGHLGPLSRRYSI